MHNFSRVHSCLCNCTGRRRRFCFIATVSTAIAFEVCIYLNAQTMTDLGDDIFYKYRSRRPVDMNRQRMGLVRFNYIASDIFQNRVLFRKQLKESQKGNKNSDFHKQRAVASSRFLPGSTSAWGGTMRSVYFSNWNDEVATNDTVKLLEGDTWHSNASCNHGSKSRRFVRDKVCDLNEQQPVACIDLFTTVSSTHVVVYRCKVGQQFEIALGIMTTVLSVLSITITCALRAKLLVRVLGNTFMF